MRALRIATIVLVVCGLANRTVASTPDCCMFVSGCQFDCDLYMVGSTNMYLHTITQIPFTQCGGPIDNTNEQCSQTSAWNSQNCAVVAAYYFFDNGSCDIQDFCEEGYLTWPFPPCTNGSDWCGGNGLDA